VNGLGSVVFIATGYRWTSGERIAYSDWLQVNGLWRVVFIATAYRWKGWGA